MNPPVSVVLLSGSRALRLTVGMFILGLPWAQYWAGVMEADERQTRSPPGDHRKRGSREEDKCPKSPIFLR